MFKSVVESYTLHAYTYCTYIWTCSIFCIYIIHISVYRAIFSRFCCDSLGSCSASWTTWADSAYLTKTQQQFLSQRFEQMWPPNHDFFCQVRCIFSSNGFLPHHFQIPSFQIRWDVYGFGIPKVHLIWMCVCVFFYFGTGITTKNSHMFNHYPSTDNAQIATGIPPFQEHLQNGQNVPALLIPKILPLCLKAWQILVYLPCLLRKIAVVSFVLPNKK